MRPPIFGNTIFITMHKNAIILFTFFYVSMHCLGIGAHNDSQYGRSGLTDFSESVTVHTDRDFYIAGETLYFRLDLLSADNSEVSGIGYLILRNLNDQVIENTSSRINGNCGYGSLYLPDTLSTGVYQLVGFTNWMRNFGEEHYTTKEIVVVNRFDEEKRVSGIAPGDLLPGETPGYKEASLNNYRNYYNQQHFTDPYITIRPSKSVYGTREKVTIKLIPSNYSGSFASLAVSVAQTQSVFYEKPSINTNADIKSIQDNQSKNNPYFLREADGRIITGQVIHKENRRGISGVTVIMTSPDTVLNLLYAKTLNDGSFHFRLNEYHEGKTLYFSIFERDWSQDAEIQLIEKLSLASKFEHCNICINELSADFIRSSQDIVRINKALDIDHHAYIETNKEGYHPEIYSLPAHSISNFNDYEYLENFHEIARELLPVLMVREQGGQYTSRMALQFRGIYGRELPPAYFLDGIYVDDINRIVHLDSDNLKNLEMHNHYWRHGDIMFPGIVALFSQNHAYRDLVLANPYITIENPSFTEKSIYKPIDYGADGVICSMPDFRQLLYWNPLVIVENNCSNKKIEFYTGDLNGEFIIRANGYTDHGEIISERYFVTVDHKAVNISASNDLPRLPGHELDEIARPDQKLKIDNASGVIIPEIPVNINEKYFDQGLSGKLNNPPHQPIGNQHYPSEDWLLGDVLLENGIVVRDKRLRYNGYLDELFWLYEGDYQQIQLDRNFIKEYTLYKQGRLEPVIFRKINIDAPLITSRDNVFGELLYEGSLQLYAYRRVFGSRPGEIGEVGTIISPSPLFVLILPEGTSKILRRINRRNLLNLFPDKRREIRNMLSDNRIFRLRSEQDLLDAVRLLEGFLEED